MSQQILDYAIFGIPVLAILILVNAGFVVLGALSALFATKVRQGRKLAAAYQQGFLAAQKEFEHEKKSFSEGISIELANLRDGILNSARAYKNTLDIIEAKVGFSQGDKDRLKISVGSATDLPVNLLAQHEPEIHDPAQTEPERSFEAPSNDDQQSSPDNSGEMQTVVGA